MHPEALGVGHPVERDLTTIAGALLAVGAVTLHRPPAVRREGERQVAEVARARDRDWCVGRDVRDRGGLRGDLVCRRASVGPRDELVGHASQGLLDGRTDAGGRAHDRAMSEWRRGRAGADRELQAGWTRLKAEVGGFRLEEEAAGVAQPAGVGDGQSQLEVRWVGVIRRDERAGRDPDEALERMLMAPAPDRTMVEDQRPGESAVRERTLLCIKASASEEERIADLPRGVRLGQVDPCGWWSVCSIAEETGIGPIGVVVVDTGAAAGDQAQGLAGAHRDIDGLGGRGSDQHRALEAKCGAGVDLELHRAVGAGLVVDADARHEARAVGRDGDAHVG